ncbi:MAG: hypothetical protein J0M19_02995, partial [Sphingomonadales bacterium]|nr:hypothetical protein [Sphingomonadales bacterium]
MNTSLSAIAALVRSGGVERGWELFEEGGYGTRHDDSAALAVKGRLLKARARLAAGALRLQLLLEAANAYARANQLTPAPYLAINAASLQYQAGNRAEAMRIASAVIDLLDGSDPPADTPYFLAATRAEALLIQGKVHGASRSMAEAVRHDPDGWDDRAATLAQLREIVSAQGGSADWLLPFTPPASLHFAGHLGLSSGGRGERCLADQIEQFLQLHHFGLAWGALAAGCDIVIAEALLARGVSVHAVLPCPVEAFATQSVAPAGTDWLHRYHAVLERCASVRNAGSCGVGAHDPLATAFAGELAIGGALLNAR